MHDDSCRPSHFSKYWQRLLSECPYAELRLNSLCSSAIFHSSGNGGLTVLTSLHHRAAHWSMLHIGRRRSLPAWYRHDTIADGCNIWDTHSFFSSSHLFFPSSMDLEEQCSPQDPRYPLDPTLVDGGKILQSCRIRSVPSRHQSIIGMKMRSLCGISGEALVEQPVSQWFYGLQWSREARFCQCSSHVGDFAQQQQQNCCTWIIWYTHHSARSRKTSAKKLRKTIAKLAALQGPPQYSHC